jgi:hypothetical protein
LKQVDVKLIGAAVATHALILVGRSDLIMKKI